MNKLKQTERILKYIEDFGGITTRDAMLDLGIYRLASRVSDLKKEGVILKRKFVKVKNRYGEETSVAYYYFDDKKQKAN